MYLGAKTQKYAPQKFIKVFANTSRSGRKQWSARR